MDAKFRTSASLVALTIGLAGCGGSLTESKTIDYQSARPAASTSLEVPPDLTAPTRDERYAVPRGVATYSGYETERVGQPRVTGSGQVLTDVANMRIERAGSQRWLVVQGSADELWPQIKAFWTELGFVMNVDRPEVGVMETDWAEDRARIPEDFVRRTLGRLFDNMFSTAERDKFRTRLEQGEGPDTVEIFISHRGMEEELAGRDNERTVWQPREADPELEAEMLRRLMIYLGEDKQTAEAALAASSEPSPRRATLSTQADGREVLVLDESFGRAWRRVGLALDRTGFAVQDRDRSEGVFYVRYIDPETDARSQRSKGLFSRLAFWRSDDGGELAEGHQYRIRVAGDARQSQVEVLTGEGEPSRSRTSQRIISLLHEQLR